VAVPSVAMKQALVQYLTGQTAFARTKGDRIANLTLPSAVARNHEEVATFAQAMREQRQPHGGSSGPA